MSKRIIDRNDFVVICESCQTMAQAATKLNLHFNTFKKYAIEFGCYKPNQGGKGTKGKESSKKYNLIDVFNGKYPQYQSNKLRHRLIAEGFKEHKCEKCGLTHWNNMPIPLELHHKDGNSHNHALSNLELLCLNCHAQTETFRSKNDKTKHKN